MHFRFVDRVLDYTLVGSPALRLVKGFPLSDDQLEAAASASRGVPNSLVLEAMAQGGWLLLAALREYAVLPLLLRINEARFAGIVRPGDRMVANASLVNYQDEVAGVRAEASVGDAPVAHADLLFVCLTQEQMASMGHGHVIRGIMDRLHGSPLVPGLPPRPGTQSAFGGSASGGDPPVARKRRTGGCPAALASGQPLGPRRVPDAAPRGYPTRIHG